MSETGISGNTIALWIMGTLLTLLSTVVGFLYNKTDKQVDAKVDSKLCEATMRPIRDDIQEIKESQKRIETSLLAITERVCFNNGERAALKERGY